MMTDAPQHAPQSPEVDEAAEAHLSQVPVAPADAEISGGQPEAASSLEDDGGNLRQYLDLSALGDGLSIGDAAPVKQYTDEELKARLEAALFLTNRPLQAFELAMVIGADPEQTEWVLQDLVRDYACQPDRGLEINDTEGYILQVRSDFKDLVERMIPVSLSQGALRTLSVIAVKAPIAMADLVAIRGSGVYDHLPELVQKQLIQKQKKGRSSLILLTRRFHELFQLSADRKQLEKVLKRAVMSKQIAAAVGKAPNVPPPPRPSDDEDDTTP